MFYSQFILAKKGPLGTIWIAAHLERKLRKNQVAETDIGVTVDSILFPEVPIALRLSGHLLLGVVRIYSRQVNYLFNDCSETLGKIKQAFHSAAVDLPPEATTAPFHTITLPETFDFDELELVPDSESSFLHLNGNFVDQHVTTREQITLQDTVDHNPYLGSSQFGLDERFGDGGYFSLGLDFDEDFLADKTPSSPGASTPMPLPKEDMTVPPSGNESTLTPLLKEDAAGPSMGCENEVTPMETDDHCEPVKSGCYEVDLLGERAKAVLGSPERDNRPNTSAQAIAVDPLIEHADSQVTLRKELDFAYSKHDTPGFYAYTPRALEACTPDLNQEYCPPDEPSTPALVDETSLPMYKEFTVENAGRFSPAFTGHFERIATSETLQGSLPPHQVQNPWASSTKEAIRSPSSASFQGFTLHQAGPVDQINGVWSTQSENAQICLLKENAAAVTSVVENAQGSSVKENAAAVTSVVENAQVSSGKENAAAVYTAFPSFPQQACLQQHRTDVRHEVPKFPGNASDSFLKSCGASLPQSVGIAFPSFPQQACLQQGRTDVRHEASKFPANASDSFLISSGASLPQSCGTAFPSFPQQACLQQGRTDIRDEGPKFSANASDSFLISSGASLPQSVGTSSTFVNSQWGDSLNQVVSAPFQQQGLSVGPYSPQTLVGVGTEPPGFQPPSTLSTTTVGQYSPQTLVGVGTETPGFQPPSSLLNTMTGGQGSMASFASPTSINPSLFASTGSMASFASPTCINTSLFASTGSYLPMENVPPSRHMEHMGMGENLAATKGSLWQPAAQQCNASSFAVNAPLMSRMGMEECETLRSAYNLEDRSANFSLLQQGMSHDRMPGLELDRNNFCSPSIEGAAKELLLPESYRTPVLRDETPFTVARTSVLSAPNLNSVPGDDDVLASILGRRTKVFKVISTPKAQRPPKASAASKRPKLPSRATPKRRKVELDTVAVLHGDVIRQQLANTEDIHRERRKAPCTRRAVWGFLRECEGQENFDEPTLPEFSSDLLELYHDVVHGRESRPRSLIGATEVKEASLEALKDDCSELDHAEDSDLLAHYVKRISMKDACPSQVVGITENLLPENIAEQVFTNEDACLYQAVDNVKNGSLDKCLEQPKEDREEETAAQQNLVEGLMGAGDAETLRAEEPSALEVGTEVLDGKEGQAFLFPDAQVAEDASSKGVTETKTEEQGAQPSELERELETLLDSGFPDSVLSKEVVDQGVAVIVQQDTVCIEEQNQPSVGLDKQASREGQIVSSSEDANLQALCIPSGGKDAAEMPVFQAAGMDIGNAEEGEDKTTTSVVFEEETHQNRHDEEMADAEPERDTDCLDEDNDVAYAEIDYSSDEQDVSIQDDSGWSTRSRNVGKYLKTVFQEMESSSKRLDQGATLGLERLLARRTRREAARMFFETLVLKTKDYIHVEQNVAYQDILLYPNSKLMKTEF